MSDLPDVYAEQGDAGNTAIVAKKKARRFYQQVLRCPGPAMEKDFLG
jgi:hypothetical protein